MNASRPSHWLPDPDRGACLPPTGEQLAEVRATLGGLLGRVDALPVATHVEREIRDHLAGLVTGLAQVVAAGHGERLPPANVGKITAATAHLVGFIDAVDPPPGPPASTARPARPAPADDIWKRGQP